MEWITNLLQHYPELAIFITLALGFWIGKFKIKKFTLGTVTSVLLVGVLIGQLKIDISGPLKSVFFLMFLFAVGYSVGPQFFRGLKKEGLPQMLFAAVMCVFCLIAPFLLAKLMGYNAGEAAGLLAGSQTMSAVLGVAEDTIGQMNISDTDKSAMVNVMPVAYAVTYIFGTAGSAWLVSDIGPRLLGGLDYVKKACKELEAKMGNNDESEQPGFMPAARPVTFRAYKISNEWFKEGKSVKQLEEYLDQLGRHLFVERVRINNVVTDVKPDLVLHTGNEVVLSGRREFVIGEENWIGDEVNDIELLVEFDFPEVGQFHFVGVTVALQFEDGSIGMAFFYELCDLGGNGFRRYATAFAIQFCPFAVLVELNPVAVDKHDIVARVQESFLHFGECHLFRGEVLFDEGLCFSRQLVECDGFVVVGLSDL